MQMTIPRFGLESTHTIADRGKEHTKEGEKSILMTTRAAKEQQEQTKIRVKYWNMIKTSYRKGGDVSGAVGIEIPQTPNAVTDSPGIEKQYQLQLTRRKAAKQSFLVI